MNDFFGAVTMVMISAFLGFLVGITFSGFEVFPRDISSAEEICATNGGVKYMRIHSGSVHVFCSNGLETRREKLSSAEDEK